MEKSYLLLTSKDEAVCVCVCMCMYAPAVALYTRSLLLSNI